MLMLRNILGTSIWLLPKERAWWNTRAFLIFSFYSYKGKLFVICVTLQPDSFLFVRPSFQYNFFLLFRLFFPVLSESFYLRGHGNEKFLEFLVSLPSDSHSFFNLIWIREDVWIWKRENRLPVACSINRQLHPKNEWSHSHFTRCIKGLVIFPSPAWMSLSKFFSAWIFPNLRKVWSKQSRNFLNVLYSAVTLRHK